MDKIINDIQKRIKQFKRSYDTQTFNPYVVKEILKRKVKFSKTKNERVLFWSVDGHRENSRYAELLLGMGLLLHGIDVAFVLCDGFLSACIRRRFKNDKFKVRAINEEWPKICPHCCYVGDKIFNAAGVKCFHMSEWVAIDKVAEIKKFANNIPVEDIEYYEADDIPHGHIVSGTIFRLFYGTMTIDDVVASQNPYVNRVYRESFCDSLLCGEAIKGAIKELKPTHLYTQHGIYTPWGPPFHYALSKNIPVTRANRCNKYNHLIFSTSFKGKIRPTHSPSD